MTITVEDGTGVENANSYVSVEQFKAWATARGYTYPADDTAIEPLLIKAMDYIESKESSFYGVKYEENQLLAWPRLYYNASTGIPYELQVAQMAYANAAQTIELLPNRAAGDKDATRETVGPITVEYAKKAGSDYNPAVPLGDRMLSYLFPNTGTLRVVRA